MLGSRGTLLHRDSFTYIAELITSPVLGSRGTLLHRDSFTYIAELITSPVLGSRGTLLHRDSFTYIAEYGSTSCIMAVGQVNNEQHTNHVTYSSYAAVAMTPISREFHWPRHTLLHITK